MKYEFYADVFVLTNLYLDFLAIYGVSEVLQQKKHIKRYLAGALFGSLSACVLFLMLKNYTFYIGCMHLLVNTVMIVICFFPAKKEVYFKAYGLMYLFLFIEGGSVEWMYNAIFRRKYYEVCVLFTGIPIMIFLYILRKKRKNVKIFYEAEVMKGEQMLSVRALYDTGNQLWDPYTSQPVQIISSELYKNEWSKEECKIRLIPFSTVANKNGCLQAFTVEEVRIWEGKNSISIKPAVLAVAEQNRFGHGEYQMILHQSACKK